MEVLRVEFYNKSLYDELRLHLLAAGFSVNAQRAEVSCKIQ